MVSAAVKCSNRDMSVDAVFLMLLALADLAFLAWLRRRHWRREREARMAESLRQFVSVNSEAFPCDFRTSTKPLIGNALGLPH